MALRIEAYRFGAMTVGSRVYTSDLLLWPDRVRERWWRREGHSVCLEDLEEVLRNPPERLLLGQGASGLMRLQGSVRAALEERGVAVFTMPTAEAVELWNRWIDEKESPRIAAGFHLTC